MGLAIGGVRSKPGRLAGMALSSGDLKKPVLASHVSISKGSPGATVSKGSSRQSNAYLRAWSRGIFFMLLTLGLWPVFVFFKEARVAALQTYRMAGNPHLFDVGPNIKQVAIHGDKRRLFLRR